MIKKYLKNNLGYTLVEIITTTAIIGSLTAIAVPNFIRIKMSVNIELVKQHLRIIGQEMNEFYNKTKRFPASMNEIINGDSSEELSITASLNSIDNRGYMGEGADYLTTSDQSTYSLKTCPKEGLFGISGDRCFILDPISGVRVSPPWNAAGVNIIPVFVIPGDQTLPFLTDPNLTDKQKTEMLSAVFEYWASRVLFAAAQKNHISVPADGILGGVAKVPTEYVSQYESLLPGAHALIKKTMDWNLYDRPTNEASVKVGFGSDLNNISVVGKSLMGQELSGRYMALEGFRLPVSGAPYTPTAREVEIKNAILNYLNTKIWTGKDSAGNNLYK
jgi:prepilin-type N-terminal cleavage/methylation domain-containing protein